MTYSHFSSGNRVVPGKPRTVRFGKRLLIRVLSPMLAILCGALHANAQTNYQRLLSFDFSPSSGATPNGALIEAANGLLYGTTLAGGISNAGTIFKLNKKGGGSTVFSFTNGVSPLCGLVEGAPGIFFGTTSEGGNGSRGVVFRFNENDNTFTVLHDFQGGTTDGGRPSGRLLIGADKMLYGTTSNGGSNNMGTIFKLNPDGTGYSIVHQFSGPAYNDGSNPFAGLIQTGDGTLYGTTQNGGTNNFGTVFLVATNGNGYLVLHHFGGAANNDGDHLTGELLQATDGALYGTSDYGGTNNAGVIFRLTTNPSSYAVIHVFSATDSGGYSPYAALCEGSDGALYGTANLSGIGPNYAGTVFKLNKDGTQFTVLHSFTGSGGDGNEPQTTLLKASDNAWYGVTASGGDVNVGTVFKLFSGTPPVTITQIANGGNSTSLQLSGAGAGQTYNIQATTDLSLTNGWQTIGSSVAGIDGTFQFLDTAASNYPVRFYRSALP